MNHNGFYSRLGGFGRIVTTPDKPMGERTKIGTTRLKTILDTVKGPLVVILEQPPETIYEQNKGINAVVQRSVSLFKVFLMLGAFFETFNSRGISYRTIQPSQWQDSEAERIAAFGSKAVDTKFWSKAYAVKNLKDQFNYTEQKSKDKPMLTADHNVCDGISIGFKCIEKYKTGIWLPPTTGQTEGM